jgi:chromosome segregation ATPase
MLQKTGEYENKTKALKEEKDSLQTHLQHLKQRINIYRENEKKKLTKLITLSNKVVKDLKKKVEFAEEILRITEINTKFETEEESFEEHMQEVHDNELSVEEQEKISDIKRLISEEEQTSIELFFQKYNRVSLNNFALESRKKLLMDENAALKAKLKEFMDGISLSNKILEDKNSLFIVNGKTNSKIKYSTKKITCVDGALFLKGQKQLKE